LNRKISSIQDNVARTKNELKEYSKKTKEIAEIKKKLAILEKKTNVIKKLEQNRFEPVQLLDTMTMKVIAKRMWFTQFQSNEKQVKISGIALDNKTIADFMTRLEGTGLFASVKLNKIQRKMMKGQSLKQFQISCLKSTPQQPAKEKTRKSRKVKRK
jgi:type IV pilus assembly protein PilN